MSPNERIDRLERALLALAEREHLAALAGAPHDPGAVLSFIARALDRPMPTVSTVPVTEGVAQAMTDDIKYEFLTPEEQISLLEPRIHGAERDHYNAVLDAEQNGSTVSSQRVEEFAARLQALRDLKASAEAQAKK